MEAEEMNEQQKPLSTEQIAGGTPEAMDARDTEDHDQNVNGAAAMETTLDAGTSNGSSTPALMPRETAQAHREHWTDIQVRFVDDPHEAVEQADELVAEVIQTVASRFAEQRKSLEHQW